MTTWVRLAACVVLFALAPAGVAQAGYVGVIDTANNRVVADVGFGEVGEVGELALSPDGARLYVINGDPDVGAQQLSTLDTATNAPVGPAVPLGGSGHGLAVSPDGSRAYVPTFEDGVNDSIRVIDLATRAIVGNVPVGSRQPNAVAVTPDGTRVYATNATTDSVSVINTATNSIVTDIPVGSWPVAIALTPDGSRAYVADTIDSEVTVIDTATNTVVDTIPVGDTADAVAITPSGARAYVAKMGASEVVAIDTGTNALVAPAITAGDNPSALAVSPDGARLYVSNLHSHTVSVINTATHARVTDVTVGSLPRSLAATNARVYVAKEGAASEPPPSGGGGGEGEGPPPPVAGRTVNVATLEGKVRTKCRGQRRFAPLVGTTQIRLGCLVDTRQGKVVLASAGKGGKIQFGVFWDGLFRVQQTRGSNPTTVLVLTGGLGCRGAGAEAAGLARDAARKRRKGRRLWGDANGRFRVKGLRGAATVRGTAWLVADRCNRTTLFRVKDGRVRVRDFARRRNITLAAGEKYVAPGPKRRARGGGSR